jgi:hypothetical protein
MLMTMLAAKGTRYNLSFTAASLRPELARIVAECYLAVDDWELSKERVLSSNALQCRTSSSAVRQEREIRLRLRCLTREQITLLAKATADDRAAMSWLAAIKHIEFAFDFAADVLREKLVIHDPVLRRSDYESYFDTKSVSHKELTMLAAVSRSKVRQVLLRMLTEADLLRAGPELGKINRPVLSPAVLRAIHADSSDWLAGFLVPDSEIGGL